MATTVPSGPVAAPARGRARALARTLSAFHLELAALLVISGTLDLWQLSRNQWANTYYAAAVRSMSSSWHDFLFVSFDPSGVMTIDKTPLALWLQALSVRAFGFHPLSILVPQALIGMATVALVYDLTRRHFGRPAGFVAGLVLAITPITVAIARHNNPDALLILCCVAALWCALRGLERGRTAWLVLAGVFVGLGFETKMAVALVVVPAIAAAWLWVAPRGRLRATGQLLQAGAAAVVVGATWPVFVALTSPAGRPWLGSTSDNSIWSLIAGYNGVGRLAGQAGGPTSMPVPQGGGGVFGGAPGPFRLLDESLGGQAGWLLGFTLVGAVAVVAATRLWRSDRRTGWLLAVGGAFATIAVAFSAAGGIFHPYYVSLLAPFSAALIGAGFAQVVGRRRKARVLGPLAVAAATVTEVVVIHNNPEGLAWLTPVLIAGGAALAVALVVARHAPLRTTLVAVALAGLMVAPAAWAVDTLGYPTNSTFPAGGPKGADTLGQRLVVPPPHAHGRPLRRISLHERVVLNERELHAVIGYVGLHGGGTLAVRSDGQAAPAIIATGARLVGLGGFSGVETEISVPWFAREVQAHAIRWVLFNGVTRVAPGQRIGAAPVLRAVTAGCARVPRAAYSTKRPMALGVLYDCRGRAPLLDALANGFVPRRA